MGKKEGCCVGWQRGRSRRQTPPRVIDQSIAAPNYNIIKTKLMPPGTPHCWCSSPRLATSKLHSTLHSAWLMPIRGQYMSAGVLHHPNVNIQSTSQLD